MKCKKYLNWLEKSEIDNSENFLFDYQPDNILNHIKECNDCYHDSKIRTKLIKILRTLPEPLYPANLKEIILTEFYLNSHIASSKEITNTINVNCNKVIFQESRLDNYFDVLLSSFAYALVIIIVVCTYNLISISPKQAHTGNDLLNIQKLNKPDKILNSYIKFDKNQCILTANPNCCEITISNSLPLNNNVKKDIITVSKEEVNNFLKKLAEFKTKHPEVFYNKSNNISNKVLDVKLVNYE